ncbi:hypothetical protein MKW92_042758, partial [Papaver armeniacum]
SKCSSLCRRLAIIKSAVDNNPDEEDGNLAAVGNVDNSEDTVGIRKNLPRNCKQPQSPKAGRLKARRSFTKRMYSSALQKKFNDNEGKYSEIIELMKQIDEAKSRVQDILEGDQELISGFNKLIAQNI